MRSGCTTNQYLSGYCDPTFQLDTPMRFDTCPFCNRTVKAKGFIVWRTTFGWSMYCHRCGTSRRVTQDGVSSPSLVISRVNRVLSPVKQKSGTLYLPEDFELNLPYVAKQWLRKYGVTDQEIARYRFGYSSRMNRLIMPVFNDGQVVYWQGRRLSGNKNEEKYLSMRGFTKNIFFELVEPEAKEVVLVEDVVSAIAVRRAGYSVIGLLGSHIGDAIIKRLSDKGIKRACIWLDPDKRKDAIKFARKLSGLGFSATALVTPTKDPKDYSITNIRSHLTKGGFLYVHSESVSQTGKEEAAQEIA